MFFVTLHRKNYTPQKHSLCQVFAICINQLINLNDMKKFLYPVLALGAIATLASCASDEPINVKEYDGTARFSIRLPDELATRFNDGTKAHKLYYSVFQDGKYVLDGVITDAFSNNLTQEVGIQLVANQEYQIVFFADNATSESNGYSYDPQTAQFGVTYSDEMINSDNFDAFVNTITYTATGEGTDVPLKRPFAQLNIGTNDLDNGSVTHIGLDKFSSTLTIQPTNILSGINFLSGKETAYSGNALSFSIPSFASLPDDVFPVDNYKYIEMNYLLVPATGEGQNSLIDATYVISANGTTGNTLNLASTPVKPNYQTNVYGSLLTTQNKFNVEIKPAFDGGWNNEAVVVKTPEEFHDAILAGKPVYIAEGTTLDLTSLAKTDPGYIGSVIRYSDPVSLVVDGKVTTSQPLLFDKGLILSGNGTLEFDMAENSGNGLTSGSTSTYQTFGDVRIDGVSIRAINQPKESTHGNALVVIQNPSSLAMTDVTVENPFGSAMQFDTDVDVTVSRCKFIAGYGENPDKENLYTALIPYGKAKYTFDDCEIIGPVGIVSAAGNAGGGNSEVDYTMTFNRGAVISTEKEFNASNGPLGMGAMFGNGNVTFNGTYLYAASGTLVAMWPAFRTISATFNDCPTNDGQVFELDENVDIVPVSDGFTFAAVIAETKIFGGNSYTFTKKLNGTRAFDVK